MIIYHFSFLMLWYFEKHYVIFFLERFFTLLTLLSLSSNDLPSHCILIHSRHVWGVVELDICIMDV